MRAEGEREHGISVGKRERKRLNETVTKNWTKHRKVTTSKPYMGVPEISRLSVPLYGFLGVLGNSGAFFIARSQVEHGLT